MSVFICLHACTWNVYCTIRSVLCDTVLVANFKNFLHLIFTIQSVLRINFHCCCSIFFLFQLKNEKISFIYLYNNDNNKNSNRSAYQVNDSECSWSSHTTIIASNIPINYKLWTHEQLFSFFFIHAAHSNVYSNTYNIVKMVKLKFNKRSIRMIFCGILIW